jgi:hypothetical protein
VSLLPSTSNDGISACALVVAIEFPAERPASGTLNVYFERALAQPLANQLAFELAKHLPSLDGLGLVWMAACFDQAQILRPELPVHTALCGLYRAGVRDGQAAQVMTLQALRGEAPVPALRVDTRLLGGPMLLLPFAIVGPHAQITAARAALEERLLDTGLTDARTALMLNQALGQDAEHARLMTLDDLAALCAVQLEHAGLSDVWRLLERAIFSINAAPHSDSVEVCELGAVTFELTPSTLPGQAALSATVLPWRSEMSLYDFASATLLARQAFAVFQAHGLNATQRYAATGTLELAEHFWIDWQQPLRSVGALTVYEDARVGVALYALLASDASVLGHAYPRTPSAHRALLERFADQAPVVRRESC